MPTHSLRRNSRDCQAKGSSRVVPSRRPCSRSATRRSVLLPRRPTDRRVAAGGRGRRPLPLPCDHPSQRRCGIGRGRPARRHAQRRGCARGQAILHSPAAACRPPHQLWRHHRRQGDALLRGTGLASTCAHDERVSAGHLLHHPAHPSRRHLDLIGPSAWGLQQRVEPKGLAAVSGRCDRGRSEASTGLCAMLHARWDRPGLVRGPGHAVHGASAGLKVACALATAGPNVDKSAAAWNRDPS